ncbi:LAG1-domain-containing protein [Meredithblackwellia eburnea MCA 4105]
MSLEPPKIIITDGARRRRSSSVIAYLQNPGPAHHLNHLAEEQPDPLELQSPDGIQVPTPLPPPDEPRPLKKRVKERKTPEYYGPKSLRWVQRPKDSFVVLSTVVALFAVWEVASRSSFAPNYFKFNPFRPFLLVSYELPPRIDDPPGFIRCRKGPLDLLFLPFWVVAFSFIRQGLTQWVVKPFGKKIGIRRGTKMDRFMEQGYAVIYFLCSSIAGVYVMRHQDSWFYQTEHFWARYPHWDMPKSVKVYYLTQFAYWLQQALVMIAGLEKPRDDYVELVIHHIITLWLVGASYSVNLTQIGIAVFVSMDIPDLLLAISKCINYAGLESTGNVSFIIFMITWGYFRHYQNIRILHSVWTEFERVPAAARVWDPAKGYFMPSWMRYQIFAPIFALQLVIAFWSFLILRIVFRMFMGKAASDVREENEAGTETDGGATSEGGTETYRRTRSGATPVKRETRKRK